MRTSVALPALMVALLVAQGALPSARSQDARASNSAASETIELPAGGLVFVPDERIVVEAQDVVLGRSGVGTTYIVKNASPDVISRIVSWPLPEIDMNSIGEDVVVLPGSDPVNFSAAKITVEGAAVALGFEQRASAFGRDITDLLKAAAVPLNPLSPGAEDALQRATAETLADLEERGAVNRDDDRIVPNWLMRTTAFWRQDFAPGKTITIGLAYAPVTASSVWGPGSLAALKETYCIDRQMQAAVAERLAKSGRGLIAHALTFSMAGNSGWSSAIPSFRLALEKSGLETSVAVCWPDLRVVGPTLIESRRRDFKPGDDIRVLFIE